MIHVLKTLPDYFFDMLQGVKTFEVRINDRGFSAGDTVILAEFNSAENTFTGRFISAQIGTVYFLTGLNLLASNVVVFTLLNVDLLR